MTYSVLPTLPLSKSRQVYSASCSQVYVYIYVYVYTLPYVPMHFVQHCCVYACSWEPTSHYNSKIDILLTCLLYYVVICQPFPSVTHVVSDASLDLHDLWIVLYKLSIPALSQGIVPCPRLQSTRDHRKEIHPLLLLNRIPKRNMVQRS